MKRNILLSILNEQKNKENLPSIINNNSKTISDFNEVDTYSLIEWNKPKRITKIILRIIIILICSIGIIMFFIIPGNISLTLIFIFKSSFPFFLFSFQYIFLVFFFVFF